MPLEPTAAAARASLARVALDRKSLYLEPCCVHTVVGAVAALVRGHPGTRTQGDRVRWAVEDLIGVWRLISYVDLDEAGGSREGPLGPDPQGLLIYGDHGHMSVSMMRGDHATAPESATVFMGYAGTWRPVEGAVKHHVSVSAHPFQVGTELTREAELDGDRLVLHGVAVIDGRPQRRVLTWQRVPAPVSAQRPAGMSVAETRPKEHSP